MSKPAARTNDMHICPVESPVPHVGGPITGATCSTVLIEGLPTATIYSICTCTGPPDRIMSGSITVVVEGKYAARKNDTTEHGGTITTGSATVLIGGQTGTILLDDKKIGVIKQALRDCISMLKNKLKLLNVKDPATMEHFKKCFGTDDTEAITAVKNRIQKALELAGKLTHKNFITVSNEDKLRKVQADVYPDDPAHTIRLDNLFWMKLQSEKLKAGLVVHELSHFKDAAGKDADPTKDVVYSNCYLRLAKNDIKSALNNADNFEHFIIAENK